MSDVDSFRAAIKRAFVLAPELSDEDSARIRNAVKDKYTNNNRGLLWERFQEYIGKRRVDGWKRACEYPAEEKVILFLDEREGEVMWLFENGNDLRTAIGETSNEEFYLTDYDTSYVIAFSHHDILYGVGSCRSWLELLSED